VWKILMSKFRTKLRELKNADVHFISLVDRAASRIPLRILKRDEETMDLSTLFKSKVAKTEKPSLAAIVVQNHQDAEVAEQVRQSIAQAGFNVDTVQKVDDDGTVVFSQGEMPENPVVIRLSDQTIAVMKGFSATGEDAFTEMATEQGFYSGLDGALILFEKAFAHVVKTEKEEEIPSKVKLLVEGFGDYVLSLVETVPAGAFKADYAIQELMNSKEKIMPVDVKKVDGATLEGLDALLAQAPKHIAENDWGKMSNVDKISWFKDWYARGGQPNSGPQNNEDTKKEDTGGLVCDKCSGKHKTDGHDQFMKDKEDKEKETKKSEVDPILAAIEGMESRIKDEVKALASKVDATEKRVDEVVKKSDTLEKAVTTVVTAAPTHGEDTPSGAREIAKKQDRRTGCFDTAYLPELRNRR
jgi:hypothetical protein